MLRFALDILLLQPLEKILKRKKYKKVVKSFKNLHICIRREDVYQRNG